MEGKEQEKTTDCSCIDDVAAKIKEHTLKQNKDVPEFKIVEGRWEHVFIFPEYRIYANYDLKFTSQKKDGTTSAVKKTSIGISFSFCPFCGKQFKESMILG